MQFGGEANNRQINQPSVYVVAQFTGVIAGRASIDIGGGVCFDQCVVAGVASAGNG
jgi:hypothetical protein